MSRVILRVMRDGDHATIEDVGDEEWPVETDHEDVKVRPSTAPLSNHPSRGAY